MNITITKAKPKQVDDIMNVIDAANQIISVKGLWQFDQDEKGLK